MMQGKKTDGVQYSVTYGYIYLLQYIISAYVQIFQCPMELDLVQQQKQMNLCKYISNRVAASMCIVGKNEDSVSEGWPDALTN